MKKVLFYVAIVTVIVILVAIHTAVFNPTVKLPNVKTIQKGELDRLKAQIDSAHCQYRKDCRKICEAVNADAATRIHADFQRAHTAVPDTVKKLKSFKVCWKLCWKAVKDKVTDGQDFNTYFLELINEPIVQPAMHANEVASDRLQTLELKLRERYTQYAADLASISRSEEVKAALPESSQRQLETLVSDIAKNSMELSFQTVGATIGGALELVFIRETIQLIVKVVGGAVAKMTGAASASVICAVADGPLPVGDVIGATITIGGIAWTIYDVYQVTKVLPQKMQTQLEQGLNDTETQLQRSFLEKSREIQNRYQTFGQKLDAQLKQQL